MLSRYLRYLLEHGFTKEFQHGNFFLARLFWVSFRVQFSLTLLEIIFDVGAVCCPSIRNLIETIMVRKNPGNVSKIQPKAGGTRVY